MEAGSFPAGTGVPAALLAWEDDREGIRVRVIRSGSGPG